VASIADAQRGDPGEKERRSYQELHDAGQEENQREGQLNVRSAIAQWLQYVAHKPPEALNVVIGHEVSTPRDDRLRIQFICCLYSERCLLLFDSLINAVARRASCCLFNKCKQCICRIHKHVVCHLGHIRIAHIGQNISAMEQEQQCFEHRLSHEQSPRQMKRTSQQREI
jgi:hypothetical protein